MSIVLHKDGSVSKDGEVTGAKWYPDNLDGVRDWAATMKDGSETKWHAKRKDLVIDLEARLSEKKNSDTDSVAQLDRAPVS
jgi:hypothetical protein